MVTLSQFGSRSCNSSDLVGGEREREREEEKGKERGKREGGEKDKLVIISYIFCYFYTS